MFGIFNLILDILVLGFISGNFRNNYRQTPQKSHSTPTKISLSSQRFQKPKTY